MKSNYHKFFLNLANPFKIDIILELQKGDKNVTELARVLKQDQSKISHALASLKHCSIVNMKQQGKSRIYSLNKNTIVPMLKLIDKHSDSFCDKNCKECRK